MDSAQKSGFESDDSNYESLEERVREGGTLLIMLNAVVASMAGSGYTALWELEGRFYCFCEGLQAVYESREAASDDFPWMIHTDGDWEISGEWAESMLDRIEVMGLHDEPKPFPVLVNGELWQVTPRGSSGLGNWSKVARRR